MEDAGDVAVIRFDTDDLVGLNLKEAGLFFRALTFIVLQGPLPEDDAEAARALGVIPRTLTALDWPKIRARLTAYQTRKPAPQKGNLASSSTPTRSELDASSPPTRAQSDPPEGKNEVSGASSVLPVRSVRSGEDQNRQSSLEDSTVPFRERERSGISAGNDRRVNRRTRPTPATMEVLVRLAHQAHGDVEIDLDATGFGGTPPEASETKARMMQLIADSNLTAEPDDVRAALDSVDAVRRILRAKTGERPVDAALRVIRLILERHPEGVTWEDLNAAAHPIVTATWPDVAAGWRDEVISLVWGGTLFKTEPDIKTFPHARYHEKMLIQLDHQWENADRDE